jgi:ATP-dependent protease ClpP protease subunit
MTVLKSPKWWASRVAAQSELLTLWKKSSRAGVGQRVDLHIAGDITAATFTAAREKILAFPHARFVAHVDSVGGSVSASLDLCAMLAALEHQASARVYFAASAALLPCLVVPYAAGCPQSSYLHHSPRNAASGKIVNSPELEGLFAYLLAKRGGATPRAWNALRLHGDTDFSFGVAEAKAAGIITRISPTVLKPVAISISDEIDRRRHVVADARRRGISPQRKARPNRRVVTADRTGQRFLALNAAIVRGLAEGMRSGKLDGQIMGIPTPYIEASEHFATTGELLPEWPIGGRHVPMISTFYAVDGPPPTMRRPTPAPVPRSYTTKEGGPL